MPPTYATGAQLEILASKARIIQLSDDEKTGNVNDAVVNLHLENAEGEINTALSKGGYAVPVVTPLPAGAEFVQGATLWLGL